MNEKFALVGTAVLLMSGSGAWADDHETTIRLMGAADAELPDAVTKEISLPDALAEDSAAVANAARGLETANENRMTRRDNGLSTAEAARERAAEMSDGAAENRENNGRSGERPDRPDRPEPAGPPGGA
jgi:hypothetical protein